jgi:hypothetical protein
MNLNQYKQPTVDAVAPDAIVFIDGKRTITLKRVDNSGQIVDAQVDFMNFVSSISVSKGIERVPGEASISARAPKHMFEGIYGSIKDTLSTMLEVEIYMKGRFLVQNEPQYYPVFWGMITNLSESETAGDIITTTITCQDMMRWLQVTSVNVQPSAYNSIVLHDAGGQTGLNSQMTGFASLFVSISTPGIIANLVSLSINENFFDLKNISDRSTAFEKGIIDKTADLDPKRPYNEQLAKIWNKKFEALSAALYIYGFKGPGTENSAHVKDVSLDLDAYSYIYGSRNVTIEGTNASEVGPVVPTETTTVKLPWIDISKLYPEGAAAFNTGAAPIFEGNLQNRLDVANNAKEQVHYEFFQDIDGTVVLKPQFYNMDTRSNPVYVIEDIDIENINVVEDESQVWTRIDVQGTPVMGFMYEGSEANPYYGFAISFGKLEKYGLRQQTINSNYITTADDAFTYAKRELVRRNSLIFNGSMTIIGRPELKLGYPIFCPGRDTFYYVTGIDHDFTFGESFTTRLTLTAARQRQRDALGAILSNMYCQTDGTASTQSNVAGKDVPNDPNNPMNNVTKLCDPTQSAEFTAQRPVYRYKTLDDILKYQGTFRFVYNGSDQANSDPRVYQQVTDKDGYGVMGDGFPFGKDLILTEDFKIKVVDSTTPSGVELASSMKLTTATGSEKSVLSFQQPLTLNQVENVATISGLGNRSASSIAAAMQPSTEASTITSQSGVTTVQANL